MRLEPGPDIRADRRLLTPGPIPPLSHLGATLYRHTVHTALRYALYQLEQEPPEAAPVQFVSLRPYLDAPKLAATLGASPAGLEVLGALVDPGGAARHRLPARLIGSSLFHCARLVARHPLRSRPAAERNSSGSVDALRAHLSSLLPALGDALLGDLLASLVRRRRRARGARVEPVQSRHAKRFLSGTRPALECLGPPDPMRPSWREEAPGAPASGVLELLDRPSDRLRGGFRERYRSVLEELRPAIGALGERARERDLLDRASDVYFLPLDLLEDLESETRPPWLDGAIASNRAEWRELAKRHAPADSLGSVAPAERLEISPELAALTPLV